jgi:hypothetical protein
MQDFLPVRFYGFFLPDCRRFAELGYKLRLVRFDRSACRLYRRENRFTQQNRSDLVLCTFAVKTSA